jgi:aldehyde dehydrogenase (NAD+)
VPAPKRAELLLAAAARLVEQKETFARDMTREMGKVLEETRGDVQEAIDMTQFMAGEGRRQYGQTCRPSCVTSSRCRSAAARCVRDDHAVELPDGHPILEDRPASGLRQHRRVQARDTDPSLGRQLRQGARGGGRSPGVVNLVTGGPDIGTRMTTHDEVKVVSFTGSTAVGRLVNQNAASGSRKSTSRWAART